MALPADLPNLRHLEAFVEVYGRGSVNAAAAAIHLSQPAVTQAIAALEQWSGSQLFTRSHLGMTPTDAAVACRRRIDRTLEMLRDAIGERPGRRSRATGSALRGITAAQLQALVAVVEHHGFSAAARQLGLARPTLHRAARELEDRLGTALFERTSFGVEPTRDAVEIARRLHLAFAELEQARAELSALAGTDRGGTVVGAMPLARTLLVPASVLAFANAYPAHTVTILDGPYEGMLDALRRGAADLLIGALRDPVPFADIVQEPLFEDPLALVVRCGHPLAGRRRAKVGDLARFRWIAPRRGSPLRSRFDALARAIGLEDPEGLIECNSLVAARGMLLGSDRIMLLSAHQVHHELASGQLATLAHPFGAVTRTIGLTLRRDWQPTTAQSALLDRLRQDARALTPTVRPREPARNGRPRSARRVPAAKRAR